MTNQNLLYIMSFLFLLVKSRQRFNPEDPLTLELQHGRITMMITIGYITLESTARFADDPTDEIDDIVVAMCVFCELLAGSDDWQ